MRRASNKPEQKLQTNVITWMDLAYPDLLRVVSPAAGFKLRVDMAFRMVRMGYQKGTPDIIILEPRKGYHGLVIELKTPTGKVSPEQTKYMNSLKAKGYAVFVARTYEEAIDIIKVYME